MAARARDVRREAWLRREADDAGPGAVPISAAEIWAGLGAGKWSFVDHFQHDGRRYFVARRNGSGQARAPALTPREWQVWARAAAGHSNKLIADALGVSATTVATHLARARSKLREDTAMAALEVSKDLEPTPLPGRLLRLLE